MNNKGQMLILKIMVAVVIFIIILIMIAPLKESITATTNATGLNCSNPAIADENKGTCIIVDFFLFYLIGAAISQLEYNSYYLQQITQKQHNQDGNYLLQV